MNKIEWPTFEIQAEMPNTVILDKKFIRNTILLVNQKKIQYRLSSRRLCFTKDLGSFKW